MDENQLRVVSFQFVANRDMAPHEESEIQHLINKEVIPEEFLLYNRMVLIKISSLLNF